jgi:hypothetical protein
VQGMNKSAKLAILIVCSTVTALVVYGLFHGYFDRGQFVIKQTRWSDSNQLAMVVERTDQDSLGGLTEFVVIGNHVFSADELKHAYHSNAVVFAATTTCLTADWRGGKTLNLKCDGARIDQAHIDVQKRQTADVNVFYENIASTGEIVEMKTKSQ